MLQIKITTLIEDKIVSIKDLETEHGLAIHIEIDGKNILFDTGQSGSFIDNAKTLDIDLKKIDYVVISHGHFDHSGGFIRLIEEINPKIKLFIGNGFFKRKYDLLENSDYKYTGNSFNEEFLKEKKIDTEYVKENIINISKNVMLFTNIIKNKEFENTDYVKYLKEDGKYKIDEFPEEISIAIKTSKGLVVVVGCSHAGIINILNNIIDRTGIGIHAVIGGTHLLKESKEKINKVIENLKEKNIKIIGFCHCTGEKADNLLKEKLKASYIENKTGNIIKF